MVRVNARLLDLGFNFLVSGFRVLGCGLGFWAWVYSFGSLRTARHSYRRHPLESTSDFTSASDSCVRLGHHRVDLG